MTTTFFRLFSQIFSRNMLICIFTGFSSGLPFYIIISLLPLWMRSEKVDLETLGYFTVVTLPFSWKFLWAPLLDRFVPPFLGRRRGWMLIFQVLLIASLASFAFLNPHSQFGLLLIAAMATLVSFFCQSGYCAGCLSARNFAG